MNKNKRRIFLVVSSRASLSRVKTVIKAVEKRNNVEMQLIIMASAALPEYGDVHTQVVKSNFDIISVLDVLHYRKDEVGQLFTVSDCIKKLSELFEIEKPDAVITIADRYETIATAICASFMNIPLIHIQGGEVSGNIDEKIRHAITKLADIHFVCTKKARENVIRMGESPKRVYNTGCPSCDLAQEALDSTIPIETIFEKYNIPYKEDYVIVLQHSNTDVLKETEQHIKETYDAVKSIPNQVLWVLNNADAGSDVIRSFLNEKRNEKTNIVFCDGFTGEEFLVLLKHCKCIVGNSSVGVRECSYMGVPAINIGKRQNCRERGENLIDVEHKSSMIKFAILNSDNLKGKKSNLYGCGNSGEQIAILLEAVELKRKGCLTFIDESISDNNG